MNREQFLMSYALVYGLLVMLLIGSATFFGVQSGTIAALTILVFVGSAFSLGALTVPQMDARKAHDTHDLPDAMASDVIQWTDDARIQRRLAHNHPIIGDDGELLDINTEAAEHVSRQYSERS